MSTKVLLDTDIGSDIDDAVCLAYLLANADCDLLGITTVTGEAGKRAAMASVMCRAAGREIPIFPGAELPLLVDLKQKEAPQSTALGKWDHDSEFSEGQAVSFMRDTIRQNPGEVVLLPIGPLTNIGLLFATDPEIPALLKGLVLMCGVFMDRQPGRNSVEWNASGDPHATAIVYRHFVKRHRSIGLDVTRLVTMDAGEVRERFRTPLLRPVLDFAEVWFRHTDRITFHDPLAATTIFDDRICQFEKGTVSVELIDPETAGMTHWDTEAPSPRHEVAVDVDCDRFFEHFFGVFPGVDE